MAKNCEHCNECCKDFCNEEIKCVYSCGCCCTILARIAPCMKLMHGTIMAQRTSDGMWAAYDHTADDGLQYPRGVLRYDVVTDDDGRIHSGIAPWDMGCGELTTNIYTCGTFRIQETVGNLAAALSHHGFGRLMEGFVGGSGVWKLL